MLAGFDLFQSHSWSWFSSLSFNEMKVVNYIPNWKLGLDI